jgi:transcription-repair coupling factor (superfamily II helicase)
LNSPLIVSANPTLPDAGGTSHWGSLLGASLALAVAELASNQERPVLLLAEDPRHADQLEAELRFFAGADLAVEHFVEWETLPWDAFSPHQDIISQRLRVLATVPRIQKGVLVASATALQQRLPPVEYVVARSLSLREGQELPRDAFIESLISTGYLRVPQVTEHGEFAVRGSLIDVFPMGADEPVRIDFFDDEIESLRWFSAESQLSGERTPAVDVLPAREVPLDADAIRGFRDRYRERFEGQPSKSRVYRDVSDGIAHGGIEYYLPLFFAETASLAEYLTPEWIVVAPAGLANLFEQFENEARERFELCNLDMERPVLGPEETFLLGTDVPDRLARFAKIMYSPNTLAAGPTTSNFETRMPPAMKIETRYEDAAASLLLFVDDFDGRIMFSTDSPGRREQLLDMLRGRGLDIGRVDSWSDFAGSAHRVCVAVAPIENGVLLPGARVAIISEQQLFGERTQARKRRRRSERDPETIIRQLSDLEPGSPVVHEEYGVGRYLGLATLETGGVTAEFLHLEYADGDKLYVPVHALELISRYTGASPENAPLHRLGSDQWEKAKRRAIRRIRDVAAELLDVYARRAARPGHSFHWSESDYRSFESGFPFDLTEDQARTIDDALEDLASDKPMDRLVCGDVGFGKTEVALRASFAAVHDGKQVVVLVPTTLLAQQHGQTFRDRFADWPVRVEVLSRFQSAKEVRSIVSGMRSGGVDIVIGTHRVLQHTKDFSDVGLVIIDEEHRFGVRHKEAIKALRSQVDVLTLTATPIPRTLNMALGGLRDMSLITTPPAERLAVKTFVSEWNDVVIREACLREIKRGGQVFFIHNRVEDIERVAERLEKLVPEASIRIGHGQMPERELEQVMLDFYHRRFSVLLCTTIIESGIDVPTANTIIINRADRFGLAQLHQLRGRVGRSHHRAYAYLVAPPRATMTADAVKRLDAIDSLEDLGSGFTLATHDLEIRGAGELLGDVQSGQIQEIGFSLYTELLGRAVESLRAGLEPDLEAPLHAGADLNFHVAALLPDDYVPDVHLRLILYKRIAAAESEEDLRDLQVELIDRFGLLPDATKNLMRLASIRRAATALGIEKIDVADKGGYIVFGPDSRIDPLALVRLVQNDSLRYRLQGSNRLQLNEDLGDLERRFATIENLLSLLAVKEGHDD